MNTLHDIELDRLLENHSNGILFVERPELFVLAILRGIEATTLKSSFLMTLREEGYGTGRGHGDGDSGGYGSWGSNGYGWGSGFQLGEGDCYGNGSG